MSGGALVVVIALWLVPWTEGGRIVGGIPANIDEFPYLTSLQLKGIGHVCVASVVTPKWLLTAAHCVHRTYVRPPVKYTVIAGYTTVGCGADPQDGQIRRPDKFVLHPLYQRGVSHTYDLAMIRLKEPLVESRHVHPVALPFDMLDTRTTLSPGTNCTVAGWGDTERVPAIRCDKGRLRKLSVVVLPLLDVAECARLVTHRLPPQAHLCTFLENYDACHGDSGAPLMCSHVQVGVVSWGFGCANQYPGIYARVDTQLPWVFQVISAAPRCLPPKRLYIPCFLLALNLPFK